MTDQPAGTAEPRWSFPVLVTSLISTFVLLRRLTIWCRDRGVALTISRISYSPVAPVSAPVMDEPQGEDGLIENCAVHVAQFIDRDGAIRWQMYTRGDVPTSTKVGLLELAKSMLIRDQEESQP